MCLKSRYAYIKMTAAIFTPKTTEISHHRKTATGSAILKSGYHDSKAKGASPNNPTHDPQWFGPMYHKNSLFPTLSDRILEESVIYVLD